jgi:DNA repair protein RecO (recombination protein O)
MLVKTKAIVISSLKYQEKSLIVRCFTQSDGLKSYFVPSAFSTKKSSQKIAYFQPFSILEIEANHKNKGTLEYFKEIKLAHSFQSIPTDIVKSSMLLFLSEMLHHSVKEEEKNENLYTFLETALLWLDNHEEITNFHLIFLIQMTKFFGFFPDNVEGNYFEMVDGIFLEYQGASCLNFQETDLLKILLGLKFENTKKLFLATERQQLLKIIIDYYTIHLDGFKKPKSLDVLKEVFA